MHTALLYAVGAALLAAIAVNLLLAARASGSESTPAEPTRTEVSVG